MNQKEKEHAVLLVSSGIHTYKQLKEHGVDVYDAVSSYSNLLYLPNGETSFNDDTVFALTEHGEDVLYQIQKENKQELLMWIAAIASCAGSIATIISIVLR